MNASNTRAREVSEQNYDFNVKGEQTPKTVRF